MCHNAYYRARNKIIIISERETIETVCEIWALGVYVRYN